MIGRNFSTKISKFTVGSTLPNVSVGVVTAKAYEKPAANVPFAVCSNEGISSATLKELFAGHKKAVLFGIPGAYTPTCSQKHLPGFVDKYEELKKKGVSLVACISTNDPFVMKAYGIDQKVGNKVLLLADGNGLAADALGMTLDLSAHNLGAHRNKRFALIVEDNVVKHIAYDNDSMVEAILPKL